MRVRVGRGRRGRRAPAQGRVFLVDLDDLTAAQTAVAELLAGLDADAWPSPTPCEDWDVAGVVRHLIVAEGAFTTSLGGTPYDLRGISDAMGGVSTGAPPETSAEGAARLREAFATAVEGLFPTGSGPMPAPAIAE